MNSRRQKHSTRKQDQIFSAKLVLDTQFKLWLFMSYINTEQRVCVQGYMKAKK